MNLLDVKQVLRLVSILSKYLKILLEFTREEEHEMKNEKY